MKKIIGGSMVFIIGVIAVYFAYSQFAEIKTLRSHVALSDAKVVDLESQIGEIKEQNRRLSIGITMLREASRGMYGLSEEATQQVEAVAEHLMTWSGNREKDFADCWDREVRTSRWGSDGVYTDMVLANCISKVKDNQSAILLNEVEKMSDHLRSECASRGENRAEAATECWADANNRYGFSAWNVLFSALTAENWKPEASFSPKNWVNR